MHSATDAELALLKKKGMQDAYDAFAEQMTAVSAQAWCNAVRTYVNATDPQASVILEEATQGFLFGICPYFTFAFAKEGGK